MRRLGLTIIFLVSLGRRVNPMEQTNERLRGVPFNKIWSLSTAYREKGALYKKFMWRRLLDHEITADTGAIRSTAYPRLCSGNDKSQDTAFSKWRLIQLVDIEGVAFQQLLLDNPDFGSYRIDGRLNLKHVLVVQSLRMHTKKSTEMVVVLTIGDDRLNFQVDIFPFHHETVKAVPTDVLCVSSTTDTLTSTSAPFTTTKPLIASTVQMQPRVHVGCVTNTIVAESSGESLDAFLIQHRATLFVVSLCCPALIMLFLTLLVLLIKRYRALSTRSQHGRVQKKYPVRVTPQLPCEENPSYGIMEPLWPKHVSPTLTARNSADVNDTDEYVACDRYCGDSANTLPLKKPSVNRGILKRTFSSTSSYQLENPVGQAVNQIVNNDADLGMIAARRFRETLRRKTLDEQHYASSRANGTLYSLLRKREIERDEDFEAENTYS